MFVDLYMYNIMWLCFVYICNCNFLREMHSCAYKRDQWDALTCYLLTTYIYQKSFRLWGLWKIIVIKTMSILGALKSSYASLVLDEHFLQFCSTLSENIKNKLLFLFHFSTSKKLMFGGETCLWYSQSSEICESPTWWVIYLSLVADFHSST